ncbi:unnamed protein product [Haemonchus placei]|uniref:Uncharacterized protein n=1 Tax=Haemonchus placei TaxID=6290 RepID=A0A0N4VTU1_HAEPC|nr:unnamed protein product [Haemonchus placei]
MRGIQKLAYEMFRKKLVSIDEFSHAYVPTEEFNSDGGIKCKENNIDEAILAELWEYSGIVLWKMKFHQAECLERIQDSISDNPG